MKKRLHYAMPRVPLHKLKPKVNNDNTTLNAKNQPESHVVTMARRIANAERERRLIGENSTDEDQISTGEDNSREETSEELRSDSTCNSESSEVVSDIDNHKNVSGDASSTEQEAGGRFNIVADVHHEDNEDELEGAMGGVMEEGELERAVGNVTDKDTHCPTRQDFHLHATFSEHETNEFISDSSIKSDPLNVSQRLKKWTKKKKRGNKQQTGTKKVTKNGAQRGNVKHQTKMQWGQEESSDSDSEGGWDFETGGMPLLPR